MGKCKTNGDERWKSKIGNTVEGTFSVMEVSGDTIEGAFDDGGPKLKGKCRESTGAGEKEKMAFVTDKHLYAGVFLSDSKVQGFRFKLADLCGDLVATTLTGEDWIGTKGT